MATADTNLYYGTITSFSIKSNWGFIKCPDLEALLQGKDVFFHGKDCSGAPVAKQQEVSFRLDDSNPAKLQARDIQVFATQEPEGAIRYTGLVTSYSSKSAWGFISCADTQAMFGKDMFFHVKDCGGVEPEKGQHVTFVVDENAPPGKPQAVSIQLPASARRFTGTVTSWSGDKAYGFIDCPSTKAEFGKDIFLHAKDCDFQPVQKGMKVSFLVDDSIQGKPQAKSVRSTVPLAPAPVAAVQPVAAAAAANPIAAVAAAMLPAMTAVLQATLAAQTGARPAMAAPPALPQMPSMSSMSSMSSYQGTVQSFSDKAGWGFIGCPALGHQGGKGIFFHIKDVSGRETGIQPKQGDSVSFVVGTGPGGKQQAQNINVIGGAPAPQAPPAPMHHQPMMHQQAAPAPGLSAELQATQQLMSMMMQLQQGQQQQAPAMQQPAAKRQRLR
eukprot:TRINITY_DN80297_c0_g1_i1.p1 TRINITY_DN80297_c0_g1~~TRINITY_DN80297_c0_g1_i1.p1  ORF type:complete len:469 (-),score=125.86 TRINITY_DN80297_c0_g1_i1:207-1532(-)